MILAQKWDTIGAKIRIRPNAEFGSSGESSMRIHIRFLVRIYADPDPHPFAVLLTRGFKIYVAPVSD